MKSQDPAASRILLGCQSRLRMVERIGFLMCLLTHLRRVGKKYVSIHQKICKKGRRPGSTGSQRPSPVILRLKVADRNEASTTANCKLVLQWRPLDKGGSSVDPEDDQRGLPYPVLLGPYVGITVCSTRHYTVAFRSPVDAYGMMRDNVLTSR